VSFLLNIIDFPTVSLLYLAHYQGHEIHIFTRLSSHDNFLQAPEMSQSRSIDHGLEALLSMNGEIFILEGGLLGQDGGLASGR
jgi:hypothetical protein